MKINNINDCQNDITAIIDKHDLIGSCIKLDEDIDLATMRDEVMYLNPDNWKNERNRDHSDALSCFLKGYPAREGKPSEERDIFESLPYTKALINNLGYGELANALLAKLKPGGIILLHTDGNAEDLKPSYFSTTIRLHIPIITSELSKFYDNGQFYSMNEGELYVINNSAKHGVVNAHPHDERIHLIFDLYPNELFLKKLKVTEREIGYCDDEVYQKLFNETEVSYQ